MIAPDLAAYLPSESIAEAKAWRQHLHRHPELAYGEQQTADFIAARLNAFGLQVHRGLAGTGVVGTLSRGTSPRTMGIRADMDALRIQERSGVPYESSRQGVMHACGHDGHVAMALAAARACARMNDLDGTVHFIFQPAEEGAAGARRMVEEGLFRLFPCDAIYALHNWPALPLGTCVVREGPMMAANGRFDIEVTGRGCHSAMPHEGDDALLAGCHVVSALQSIASRNIDPLESAVVSVTEICAGGEALNAIPDRCTIRGSARWFEPTVGELVGRRLSELSRSVAAAYGCDAQVKFLRGSPATINDAASARFVRSVIEELSPALRLLDVPPSMASEDFSFMLEEVPGCYFWLGSAKPDQDCGLHSPSFDFNDDLLPLGAAVWASLVRKSLTATA